jgi:hypothetical protein
MSEILRKTLLDQGCWFRAEAEEEWSQAIHPHYRFDKDNLSYGFCGVTSVEQARRLDAMNMTSSVILHELGKKGIDESSRAMIKLFDIHQFFGILDETKGLIGTRALFAYGLVESFNGDIITDDHCWVVVEAPNESYDLDDTGDQFNVEGLDIPPVLVQHSKEFDGQQIRHIPKELEPISTFDRSNLAKRLNIMTMGMPGWRRDVSWNYHKTVPSIVKRYEELKKITQ